MKLRRWLIGLVLGLPVAGLATLAYLEADLERGKPEPAAAAQGQAGRPAANPLRNAYFGELHLHTAVSLDASIFDAAGGPRSAYRFARGEEMVLPGSQIRQRLRAPLDFAAVTDHAEGMGMLHECYDKAGKAYWNIDCIGIRHKLTLVFPRLFANVRQEGKVLARYNESTCEQDGKRCIDGARGVWQETQAAAREYYAPGFFTTFIGYEYSPTLVDSGMLHRNVIFRGDKVPGNVFSAMDGFAEDLMRWLDLQCKGDCQAMTIPHNPNFSWGLMFGERDSNGSPASAQTRALRARYDTLVEIFQAKGSSECTKGVGNNDEQCGFENIWPACTAEQEKINATTGQHAARCVSSKDMVRNILRDGLAQERKSGLNPAKLGIVGGTDNHNGAAGDTQESSWNGHGGVNDATPERRLGIKRGLVARSLGFSPGIINPGGLTGVWAEENTREAIWDAMQRRETFATSGTRVRARLFAGFDLPEGLHKQSDAIRIAYEKGVPMGGDLPATTGGKAPVLVAWALRDANSAPLQRLQIVKGWTSGGETKERVFDIACADGIVPDKVTQRCADNGARVDLRDCSISRDKGAAELATTWRDPDFDPAESAFYYLRVLENPVCRYSQHDAIKIGAAHPPNVPPTIQERAWTSPIWYQPRK